MKLILTGTVTEESGLTSYIDECKTVVQEKNYDAPEASLCLPTDSELFSKVMDMVQKMKTPRLKYVFVIGIGGSNLGAKAVYDALFGYADVFHPERFPKLFFLDTVDPEFLSSLRDFMEKHIIHEDELVVAIISKSGGTTETIVNAEIVMGQLKDRFPAWEKRCVVITDLHSKLHQEAQRLGIDFLEVPKKVGGRYSVLSPVGLFPLALLGIDIAKLLAGAEEMRERCLEHTKENPAQISSTFLFHHLTMGKNIHDSFFFHPELESLGKWYRQLMGESIGKEGGGITPIVTIGSIDLHSMAQLYLGGPKDKTTEFIYSNKSAEGAIPQEALFPSLNTVSGKSISVVMSAIQEGTSTAYQKQQLPFFEIAFDEVNCFELGSYMQYKMMEIMYLAHLLKINAFDQPQVELYKIETKRILLDE